MTRQTVSHWESDKTLPDLQSLQYLAAAFDTTIDDLVDSGASEAIRRSSPDRQEVLLLYLFSFFVSMLRAIIVLGIPGREHSLVVDGANMVCTIALTVMFARIGHIKRAHSVNEIEDLAAFVLGYKNARRLPKKGVMRFVIDHWYALWFLLVLTIYIAVECAR